MKGVYCLVISVQKDINVKIGAIGRTTFKKGKYVYVGSAQNSLEKRTARHFREGEGKKTRWHIDYLLENADAKPEKALYKNAGKEEECAIALHLAKTEEPVKGFGCSDCKCSSHLFRMKSLKELNNLKLKNLKLKKLV
ncbi:MAG: GIY-YIG nuclease family protein [Candidatus Diapherotrites archaeon]|nr:GIY-YIG nuclease family protein [Candidatus Diapherotrites archaeon]